MCGPIEPHPRPAIARPPGLPAVAGRFLFPVPGGKGTAQLVAFGRDLRTRYVWALVYEAKGGESDLTFYEWYYQSEDVGRGTNHSLPYYVAQTAQERTVLRRAFGPRPRSFRCKRERLRWERQCREARASPVALAIRERCARSAADGADVWTAAAWIKAAPPARP